MKTLYSFVLLVALSWTAFGCANREKQLVGTWTGKVTVPESKKDDPAVKMAEAFLTNLSLELKEDKTFTMTMMFPIEGIWSVAGDILSLKIEKFMGMTVDQAKSAAQGQPGAENLDQMKEPMEFRISSDAKTLTAVKKGAAASAADQGDLVFTKSEG